MLHLTLTLWRRESAENFVHGGIVSPAEMGILLTLTFVEFDYIWQANYALDNIYDK